MSDADSSSGRVVTVTTPLFSGASWLSAADHDGNDYPGTYRAGTVRKFLTIQPRSREYLSSLATAEAISRISMYAIFDVANRVESRTLAKR